MQANALCGHTYVEHRATLTLNWLATHNILLLQNEKAWAYAFTGTCQYLAVAWPALIAYACDRGETRGGAYMYTCCILPYLI